MAGYNVCVNWCIENFSFCSLKGGEFLQSPYFRSFSKPGGFPALWFLRLYPMGTINNENYLSCFLCRQKVDERFCELDIGYKIRILSTDGGILLRKNNCFVYGKAGTSGFDRFVSRNDIFRQKDSFLPNDKLQIRLSMAVLNFPSLESEYCFFTVINVEKYSFIWQLEDNISNTKEITFFRKHKFAMTGIITDNVLKLNTEALNVQCFAGVIKWELLILQMYEPEKMIKEGETYFGGFPDAVSNSYELTLSPLKQKQTGRSKKQSSQARMLELTRFRCQLTFARIESEEEDVEAHSHGYAAPQLKPNVLPDQTSDNHDLFRDFLNMYRTKKLTDVTLRVGDEIFQAHKFVLSARSPVFSAMFEKDMLENQSGVVDIKYLDADTLKNFLLYLYGGTLQKLNRESARKLILVADRYLVTSLKEICSSYFASNMTEETVCETLILADMINDENLKETAINFFVSHAKAILKSLKWKQFQDNYLKLAKEALMKFALEACSKSSI